MTLKLSAPEIWKVVPLHKATEVVMGQSPAGEFVNQAGEGVPFFQGKAEFGELHPKPRKYCTQPKKMAVPGDVLLSVRAPVGPTNLADKESCIGRGLSAVRAAHGVDGKYLLYYFRNIESWMSQQGTGSTFKAVSGGFIKELPFALPSLAEQKVIADKLDELLAQVNNLKARLDAIPAILKRFRQSVLAAAVSGKLTEEWRRRNGVVLARDVELDAVIESSFYGPRFSKNDYVDGGHGVPTIRTTDMDGGVITVTPDTPRVVVPEDKIDKFRLMDGDLLITRTGSIGVMAIFNGGALTIPSAYLIRFRLKDSVCAKYILFALTSPHGQRQMGVSATALTQPNINAKSIRSLKVKLPSLDEQKEIVRRVDQFFTFADQVEQQVKNAQACINKLTQSILAKAFRGELTAEWRAENPELISGENSAEALLERIKAEKEQRTAVKKRRGGRTAMAAT